MLHRLRRGRAGLVAEPQPLLACLAQAGLERAQIPRRGRRWWKGSDGLGGLVRLHKSGSGSGGRRREAGRRGK